MKPKLDGWRALVLYRQPGRNVTESVPQLAGMVNAVPARTVLDGELVAGSGRASSLYAAVAATEHPAGRRELRGAFDLLALGGRSLISAPYQERRGLLAGLELVGPAWCSLPMWTDVKLADLLAACELQGVEGLVAKRVRSRYRPGRASPDWVKVKTHTWRTTRTPLRTVAIPERHPAAPETGS